MISNRLSGTIKASRLQAFHEGYLNAGVEDNQMIIWSELMDSKTLLLTANADVVYYIGFLDLTKGPMVLETARRARDDRRHVVQLCHRFWSAGSRPRQRWQVPDRAPGLRWSSAAGRLLRRTVPYHACLGAGRSFLVNGDPKPAADLVKKTLKMYPYVPGGQGASIAEILTGTVKLGKDIPPPPMRFVEGTGMSLNTIPPSDYRFYEMMDRLVQQLGEKGAQASTVHLIGKHHLRTKPQKMMKERKSSSWRLLL
jgi:hypothetical protein